MKGDLQHDMIELGRSFELGFFSDSILRTIRLYKSTGEIPREESIERSQLAKAYEFLQMVEKGKEQVDSCSLQSNAVDSIGAYRRSLSAFFVYRQPKEENFRSYIDNMKNGIDRILKSEDVNPQEIESIERFFKAISESTLVETEGLLEKRKEIPRWMLGSKML